MKGDLNLSGACTKITERFGGCTRPDRNRNLRGTPDGVGRFPAEGIDTTRSGRSYSPDKDYSIPQALRHPVFPRFLTTKTPDPARESWLSGADYPPRKTAQDRLAPLTGKPSNKRVLQTNRRSPFGSRVLDLRLKKLD